MSLKMKKILAVAAIVLIIAIIAVVVILSNNNEDDDTAEQIQLAKQYYELMDYDKSAAIYNSLLKTNADEPDVYMGLYDIYMVMGREEKAVEILERGVQNTNNKAIEDKLAQINGVTTTAEDPTETAAADETVSAMSVSNTEISETVAPETTTTPSASEEESETDSETEETTETTEETTTSQTTTTRATTTTKVTTTTSPVTTTRRVTTTARPVVTTVRTTTTAPVTTTKLTTTKKPEPVGEYDIKQRSVTDYVLTRDAVRELGIPSNAIINVIANNVTLSFNSSVFDDVYSINLSVALSHTTTKSTIKFKDNTLPCDVTVIVSSATMSDKTLALAHLFRNGTDYGKINLSAKGYPMFTAKGGTYSIERVEEVTTVKPVDDGIVVIGVGNIGNYKLTDDDVKGVGSNKVIRLKSINADVFLNSSVFSKQDEVDLGFTITNNTSKSVIEFKNSSSFGCEIKLVLTTCDMSSRNLAKAHIYRNGVDLGKVSVDSDGNPYFTATSGGKYVIMVPEE